MKFKEFLLIVLALQAVNSCVVYALLVHAERTNKQIVGFCRSH
jgi:hypothetical protein